MEDLKTLKVELDEVTGIVYLILNRPSQRNALDTRFFTEFPRLLSALDENSSVRIIILKSSGNHFCSGIDLSTLSSVAGSQGEDHDDDGGRVREKLRRNIKHMQAAFSAVEECRKPVIAAIHGACIGAGVDLITACDIRYCSEDASFCVKEVDIAIPADLGTLQRLPRLVGDGNARELSLTGRRIDSLEAKHMGLVQKVYPTKSDMDENVHKIARDIVAGYAQIGCAEEAWVLFRRMQVTGTKPDAATVVSLISGYANLADPQQGKWIHAYIIKIGFEMNVTVRTVLIDMYCRCRSIQIARTLFDKTPQRNVVSWTAIIAGYTRNGEANEALRLFHEMQLTDIKPNKITILSVLSACTNLVALQLGKDVHDYVVKNSLESDVCVGTALVAMYAKCRCVEIACELFVGLPKKDVVSWNAMLAGYAQNGHLDKAMLLFHKMLQEDVKPNQATIVTMLPLCPHLIDLKQAKSIHAYAIRNALESDISVGNALIDMYAKFGSIEMAHMLFNKIPKKDLVSWNTMISGYSQNRLAKDAFSLFHQMQLKGVEPDQITVVTILHACAELAAWQQGKEIHGYIIIMGFESDVSVIAALVTMYKHGNIEAASQLFYSKWERDLVLWNSMIAGVSQNGFASEALTLFHQMQFEDMKPDRVTIMSILPAYADIGSLQLAKVIHMYIIKNGFETDVSVQTALITLYTKCGSVDMACHLFESMSERDVVTWNAMIASYGMHGFGKDALALFTQMQQTGVKADHVTFISILSACSHAGLLDQGKHYFNCMSPDYHIAPVLEHYTCMVDILGRAGYLDEAYEFIAKMPLEPDAGVWGALLGACRIHGNLELGEHVSEKLISLNPKNVSNYVSLSNIYAAAGRWDGVLRVRRLIKSAGIEKIPGCSWIEIKNEVHSFVVGDT